MEEVCLLVDASCNHLSFRFCVIRSSSFSSECLSRSMREKMFLVVSEIDLKCL